MSCERCKDIHQGQILGQCHVPCPCDCHGYNFTYPIWCGTGDCITGTTSVTYSTCSDGSCTTLNLNNE